MFRGNGKSTFLDIGLWLDKPTARSFDLVCVYFPHVTAVIEDLGKKFTNGTLAAAIFNEPLDATDKKHFVQLRDAESTNEFVSVHKLAPDEYKVEEDIDGTVVLLNNTFLQRIANHDQTYIRFRVQLGGTSPYVLDKTPWDARFLSGFDLMRLIDFRVNDTRNLPDRINRKIVDEGNSALSFERIDFLVAMGVEAEVLDGHQKFHKCRRLENDIWAEYVKPDGPVGKSSGKVKDDMMVFHWKSSVDADPSLPLIRDFIAFIRFRMRRSDLRTVAMFSGVTLILGAIGSFIPGVLGAGWKQGCEIYNNVQAYLSNLGQ